MENNRLVSFIQLNKSRNKVSDGLNVGKVTIKQSSHLAIKS